jgi:cellulose synthase/poly-beta-1,6-N-acetylglucosamine synthase-like glycosyltransferase
MFVSFWWISIVLFCLSYHPCVNQHGILVKCTEWIKNTMDALGARWRKPTLQMTLDWVFKVVDAWATSIIKMTHAINLFNFMLAINYLEQQFHSTFHHKPPCFEPFHLPKSLQILWCLCPSMSKVVNVIPIMLSTMKTWIGGLFGLSHL